MTGVGNPATYDAGVHQATVRTNHPDSAQREAPPHRRQGPSTSAKAAYRLQQRLPPSPPSTVPTGCAFNQLRPSTIPGECGRRTRYAQRLSAPDRPRTPPAGSGFPRTAPPHTPRARLGLASPAPPRTDPHAARPTRARSSPARTAPRPQRTLPVRLRGSHPVRGDSSFGIGERLPGFRKEGERAWKADNSQSHSRRPARLGPAVRGVSGPTGPSWKAAASAPPSVT